MRCPFWKIPNPEIGAVQRKRVAGENAFEDMHRRELELQESGFAFSAGGDFDLVDVVDARGHDESGVAQGLFEIEATEPFVAGRTRRRKNRRRSTSTTSQIRRRSQAFDLRNRILDLAPRRHKLKCISYDGQDAQRGETVIAEICSKAQKLRGRKGKLEARSRGIERALRNYCRAWTESGPTVAAAVA